MKYIKLSLFLINSLFISNFGYSQNNHFCGQSDYQQKLYKEYPNLKPEVNPSFKKLESFTQQHILDQRKSDASKRVNVANLTVGFDYIIPVVVHVVHNNGYENLSDKTIERAIEMLNSFYAGTSAFDKYETQSFLNIRGGFNGNGKKLRFVLAKFDPNGNATNGIHRVVDSFYTLRGDYNGMRQAYNWPRKNYFNIYIVRQAVQNDGRSGFATFPFEVDTQATAYLDGHIMSAWAFGEHENTYQTWYHNLAHEVGHWLNVYHIWDQMKNNGDFTNCSSGTDLVADTPQTTGNQLADFDNRPAPGTTDTCITQNGIDNYTNMMDYTAATYAMFTQGQKDRMTACLESNVAERNNLWSKDNVLAKIYGCTTGLDSDNDGIPDSCDPCPTSATNDADDDGVCDTADLCNGFPDVNLDANPSQSDACDPLLPIINFNTTPYVNYDATLDKGVGFTYDNGATLHTSINAWKAVAKNYTITPNTVIEFDFKSTIPGQAHYIGIDNDLLGNPLYRYKLYGTNNDTNTSTVNTNFNTYTNADLHNYKHYKINIGQSYTGNINYLVFAAKNSLLDETNTWNASNTFNGTGSYNDATSFFRNVKIYESTILADENFELTENNISIYSNHQNLFIETNKEIEEIEIFNLLGQKIKEVKNINSKNSQISSITEKMIIAKVKFIDGTINTKKVIVYQ
ncbi:M43 family zinc metalloprotease [Flavobacterium sp.]|uniref:M43 family zinc metalloprotease n=1 Tax=Flavobacterium sp. TaxID=239 RepID=UPI003D11EDFC